MNRKLNIILAIFTPILILIICVAISVGVLIKPYNKISTYLNLAFMDNLKTIPDTSGITAGLNIKDNEITVDYDGTTSSEGDVIRPDFGEQFAKLRSDAFELNIPVYWGSNSNLFERGACQASNSVLPGEVGNAVISAHVNTFFAELENLEIGDRIIINTNYGVFTYEVATLIEFQKTEKTYVLPKNSEVLTLYTCKPDVLGSSDTRIGVVCNIIDKQFYNNTEGE